MASRYVTHHAFESTQAVGLTYANGRQVAYEHDELYRRTSVTEGESPALRFAKVQLLRTIPWLRANQKSDGLWDHEELSRYGSGELNRPPSRRLGTYHIVSALQEFGLLDRLRP